MKKSILPAVLLFLFLASCHSGDRARTTTDTAPATPAETTSDTKTAPSSIKYDYPADVTQNFMNSCTTTSGGKQEMCSCLLDKVQRKYTLEQFTAIEKKIQQGETDADFMSFVETAKTQCGAATADSKPGKYDYPADAVQNFMNSCSTTSGGKQETCSCLLDKIQRKYTFEEFSAIDKKISEGGTDQDFDDFIDKAKAACTGN